MFREEATGQLHTIMTTLLQSAGEVSVLAERSRALQEETEDKIRREADREGERDEGAPGPPQG